MHQRSGKTIVLVTHDIDEALLLATRIVMLRQGRVVQVGTPLELLAHPADDFVLDFIGRADLGIKLLSLKSVAPLVRHQPAPANAPALPCSANLREAVACLAAHGCATLAVLDTSGQPLGSLRAADVFAETSLPDVHG